MSPNVSLTKTPWTQLTQCAVQWNTPRIYPLFYQLPLWFERPWPIWSAGWVDVSWETKGNKWKAEVDDSLIRYLKPPLFTKHHRILFPKWELHLAIVFLCWDCFIHITTIHLNLQESLQQCHKIEFSLSHPFYFLIQTLLVNSVLSPPLSSINLQIFLMCGEGSREGRCRERQRERERETSLVESKQVIILIIISVTQCYKQAGPSLKFPPQACVSNPSVLSHNRLNAWPCQHACRLNNTGMSAPLKVYQLVSAGGT